MIKNLIELENELYDIFTKQKIAIVIDSVLIYTEDYNKFYVEILFKTVSSCIIFSNAYDLNSKPEYTDIIPPIELLYPDDTRLVIDLIDLFPKSRIKYLGGDDIEII